MLHFSFPDQIDRQNKEKAKIKWRGNYLGRVAIDITNRYNNNTIKNNNENAFTLISRSRSNPSVSIVINFLKQPIKNEVQKLAGRLQPIRMC